MSTSANKDVKICPGAVVCVESKLRGQITIGSMTVIHPKASIIAEAGPVILGENNIVEEQATIVYKSKELETSNTTKPLVIGVNNVFEVGCEIHAKSIGDHNVFEPKCYVGPDVEIGNGTIVGAGCRLTVAERLPDQTVVTGRDCTRSAALDKPPAPDDTIRQRDELTVLSEIFTADEFWTYQKNNEVCAVFEACIQLPQNLVLCLSQDSAQTDFPVQHLPPVRLVASLPQNYPSVNAPYCTLSSTWLSKSKLDTIARELENLWSESKSEILFIWFSFLKDQCLELLNISNRYDLTEKYASIVEQVNENLQKQQINNVRKQQALRKEERKMKYTYHRKTNNSSKDKTVDEINFLRIKAKEKLVRQNYDQLRVSQRNMVKPLFFSLIEYNAFKASEEFKRTIQDCNVCFSGVLGENCRQLNCGHVTCVECLKRMCEVHIRHGTMESIVCSEPNCGLELPANLIKDLVSQELYEQFDRLMLNRTLDKISQVYCPRVNCQYPISSQGDESLAICPSCNHAFCVFCKRAYHGVEGCKLKSEEKKELIEAYQDADLEKRMELEKRYGKKQLTELVNNARTEQWMSENSKPCPCCNVNIEKNDGCNKMICRKCNANFCWMCLTRVSSLNPYLHYQDPSSKCFNLLFEGATEVYDEEFEEELRQNGDEEEVQDDEEVVFVL